MHVIMNLSFEALVASFSLFGFLCWTLRSCC